MARWSVILVLVAATAVAQPPSVGAPIDVTTRAWNASVAAERQYTQVAGRRNAIEQRRQDELKNIDRLKKAPRSWSHDRELREALADANDLSEQVDHVNAELATAQSRLRTATAALIAAIDAELAAGPSAARKDQLVKARAQVAPQSKAHRIVLPDMQFDPLAEPEELDQQAQALRTSEVELANQVKGLDSQAKELDRIAMVRKAHERTKEMESRDDNSSRHNTTTQTGGSHTLAENPTPAEDSSRPGGGAGEPAPPPSFEMDATITLAEVVDPSTIDALNRAQRSNDPKKRAAAARLTRDAVAKKLDQMTARRKQIEDRARALRTSR